MGPDCWFIIRWSSVELLQRLEGEARARLAKRELGKNGLLFFLGVVHVAEHFVEHVVAQVFVRRQQLDKLLALIATELVDFTCRSGFYDFKVGLKQA